MDLDYTSVKIKSETQFRKVATKKKKKELQSKISGLSILLTK